MPERAKPTKETGKTSDTMEEVTHPAIKRGGAADRRLSDTATTVRMQRGRPIEDLWQAQGIDPDEARVDAGGTIVPGASTQRSIQPARPEPPLRALPALHVTDDDEPTAEYRLGRVLGSGGMGIVQTATQTTLHREVAIKSLRSDADVANDGPALLLEAQVTGTLDHPNVVPVHAIGKDQADRPLIVMKRIEGTSWEELLAELDDSRDAPFEDALTRHLTILVQVARALAFAHSRGILHRDVKPSNVMIGEFGEVYLVDWGIAVALDDRAPAGLPRAADCDGLAGTAAYMAPEMAACAGESLSVRTDVYLLGAVLHELITGFPPHDARNMRDALRRAFESKRHVYGSNVPPALAAICHKAMAWNPDERYEDAGAFATAVEEFLHHRGSTTLSDAAQGRLAQLEQRAASVDPAEEGAVRELRALFSETRFALTHALRIWPENENARIGLQRALELLIDFELRSGAPDAAALLLDELLEPAPDLQKRVERAVGEQRSLSARLHALEHDVSTRIGDRLRSLLMVLFSVLWSVCCIGTGLARRYADAPIGAREFAWVCAIFGSLLALAALVGRNRVYANAASKRIAHTTVIIFGAYTTVWLLGAHFRLDVATISAMSLTAGGALWLSLAQQGQRRWLGMATGTGVALAALVRWPEYNFEWMGVSSLLGGLLASSLRLRTLSIERRAKRRS